MEDFKTNWTKEELKTYVLIYCANADFSEAKVEIDFIKEKVSATEFSKMHAEFEGDNDYQSIQKIEHSMETLGYSKTEKDVLFEEIKALFLTDKDFDILEQNLFRGLKNLLK